MSTQAKIFIDGAVGTTGLEIRERLAGRSELSLMVLPEAERKDAAARKRALNAADVVILCLPDEAAKEAVTLIDNPATRVIDASSAHRVAEGWVYGFAELAPDQADATRSRQPSASFAGSRLVAAILSKVVDAGI